MNNQKSGGIGLSVFLCILIAITGTVFLNSLSARQTFQKDNMRSIIDVVVTDSIESRLNYLDISSYVDSGKITDALKSTEFDNLLDQYAEYLSEYMLSGKTDKEITENDLIAFITPYVEEWTSDLSALGVFTESMKQSVIETIVSTMSNVFVPLDDYLSDNLAGTLQFALSATVRNISLILTIIFAVLLFLTARLRRFLGFLGAATAIAGIAALGVGQGIYSFFFDMFNNPFLPYLLQDYSDRVTNLSIVIAVVGGVVFIIGVIIGIIMRPRNRSW